MTATGTIMAGEATLALSGPIDFTDGQGILVAHAGAPFAALPPSGVSARPEGATGATRYAYSVAACDGAGGVGGAVAAPVVENGNARLGVDDHNRLGWTANGAHCWAVWRAGRGQTVFLGTVSRNAFDDVGQTPPAKPFWIPATPPQTPLADWLVTVIRSGGGTRSPMLAAAAGTTASEAFVAHDDTAAVAAWIAQLNRSAADGSCPPGAAVRTTGLPPAIVTSGVHLLAEPGCTFWPAGAEDTAGTAQGVLSFVGPGPGPPARLAQNLAEGSDKVEVAAPRPLSAGGYAYVTAPAPSSGGAKGFYSLIAPIAAIEGDWLRLGLPSPLTFAAAPQTMTLAGTPAGGESLEITVGSAALPGSPVTVTYRIPAEGLAATSCAGWRPLACLARNLAAALDAEPRLSGPGILATSTDAVVSITAPAGLALAWSRRGSGRLKLTVGTGQGAAITPWMPLADVGARGLTIDGTNLAGSLGGGLHGILAQDVAHGDFHDITGRNIGSGATLFAFRGLDNAFSQIRSDRVGNANVSDFMAMLQTKPSVSAIRSRRSSGFGPQIAGSSWVTAKGIDSDGVEIGRGIKFAADAQCDLADLSGTNSASTGIAWSIGTYKCNARRIAASGNRGARGNAVGIWFSDQWNRDNALSEVRADGNAVDIAVYPSDLGNRFSGVTTAGLRTIVNAGRARFADTDGCALAEGMSGPGGSPLCSTGKPR